MSNSVLKLSNLRLLLLFLSVNSYAGQNSDLKKAELTLKKIYLNYGIQGSCLLRETYPFNAQNKVTYLANADQSNQPNIYSYLWPYSGSITATGLLLEISKGKDIYKKLLERRVLPGLEQYKDTSRIPVAYASYIKTSTADRFYDDNIWIGIDFVDLYKITGDEKYKIEALKVWRFIQSGTDNLLGGGVYWCEQRKNGKNTCSNAPAAVFALKLFQATKDSLLYQQGLSLYNWTKTHLQDTVDYLYCDNINLRGKIDKAKYSYNSGQMMQAAALLYKITGDSAYLFESERIAQSAFKRFFHVYETENGLKFPLLNKGDIWFTAVLFRGYVELYKQNYNLKYVLEFKKNLDYAWENMREKNGLFDSDWSGKTKDKSKWLLTQLAMVEMYARMSTIDQVYLKKMK